ncbi:hypothetical protein WJX73_010036 [Symbiochloris irregularis]|uniref:Uncharacterized protein n=1 Tax=Symbiochloris irregularis TaxID=706552 RepID=A0AAW1P7C5_9CHLO
MPHRCTGLIAGQASPAALSCTPRASGNSTSSGIRLGRYHSTLTWRAPIQLKGALQASRQACRNAGMSHTSFKAGCMPSCACLRRNY